MKQNVIKIVSIVAVVAGAVGLYISGTSESVVAGLVSGVFVVAGIIAAILKGKQNG